VGFRFDMKRVGWSLALGTAAMGIIWLFTLALDRPGQDRLFPDCFLRPGLYLSILVPDSHFNGVTDSESGPISSFVFLAANIAVYSVVIYLILRLASFVLWLIFLTRKSRYGSPPV
jgi:hypothetical protein